MSNPDARSHHLPPAILTFLAPADRCNQHCPACILDRVGEPVREFALSPNDYARFIEQFAEAGVPVLAAGFQGYEVTLPRSWPYVEAAFREAQSRGIPRDFVTNGMLLHKWIDRIVELSPRRISVSLDGSDDATNDSLRGLRGALALARSSIERCLMEVPGLEEVLAVVSTLFPGRNQASLQRMPRLLREIGIRRWSVGWELDIRDTALGPTGTKEQLRSDLLKLQNAAVDAEIRFHVSDDFGYFGDDERKHLRIRRPFDPELLIRVDPLGGVRRGKEIESAWNAEPVPRWNPRMDDAVEVSGYWSRVEFSRRVRPRLR